MSRRQRPRGRRTSRLSHEPTRATLHQAACRTSRQMRHPDAPSQAHSSLQHAATARPSRTLPGRTLSTGRQPPYIHTCRTLAVEGRAGGDSASDTNQRRRHTKRRLARPRGRATLHDRAASTRTSRLHLQQTRTHGGHMRPFRLESRTPATHPVCAPRAPVNVSLPHACALSALSSVQVSLRRKSSK